MLVFLNSLRLSFVGNMRPVIANSFPALISSRLKKFAGIFPYRYNTKIRGGFLKFLKKSPRPAVAGRVIKWGVVWFSRQPEQGQGYASAVSGAMLIRRPIAS
jgi:hypothetical protein